LIVDGHWHSSHLNIAFLNECDELDILVLILLRRHSTYSDRGIVSGMGVTSDVCERCKEVRLYCGGAGMAPSDFRACI
jgi:hypothetical protein